MSTLPRKDNRTRQNEANWSELVQRNLPLVKYVLGKLSRSLPPTVDRDDLFAAGSLGLTEAAKRFDPSRNVPFHSFALPRIWGAMLDELRSHDHLPTDVRMQVTRVRQVAEQMQQAGSAAPRMEEIADTLGYSVERVACLMRLARAEPNASHAAPEEDETPEGILNAHLGLPSPRGPYEAAEFEDRRRLLAEAIAQLPERERQVIMLRYHEDLLLHEIGEVLGVTESRVCQIHAQALKRLRAALARVGLGAP